MFGMPPLIQHFKVEKENQQCILFAETCKCAKHMKTCRQKTPNFQIRVASGQQVGEREGGRGNFSLQTGNKYGQL